MTANHCEPAIVDIQASESSPIPKRRAFYFSKENAREMQARAVQSKLRNLALAKEEPVRPPDQKPEPLPEPQPVNAFVAAQVARVRGHLAKLDELLDKALAKGDAQAIEKLTRARVGLEETERKVSDRSLPVVRRVAEVKQPSGSMLSVLSPPQD